MSPGAAHNGRAEDAKLFWTQKQLPSLNGIRAIAALLVVFYRAGVPGANGGTGVLIFFVLSGFLITWLLLAEHDRTGAVSLRKFYVRRALRIFPAFYCYWLIYVVIRSIRHTVEWPQAWASFGYAANYYQAFRGDPNTGLSHTWSLGIEEQFYLLWPAVFIFLARDRIRLRSALIAGIGAIWIHRLAMLPWAAQGYVYEAFDTRADHLLIGCLLAVALRTGWRDQILRVGSNAACGGAALAALCGLSVAGMHLGPGFRDSVEFLLEPILTACLIVYAVHNATGACRFLNWRWIDWLGRISYGIYLYQQIMVGVGEKVGSPFGAAVGVSMAVVATVAAATGSYYVVERRFLGMKARYS